jgi:hypothetical protein
MRLDDTGHPDLDWERMVVKSAVRASIDDWLDELSVATTAESTVGVAP